MILRLAALIQYRRMTHRQTDRKTRDDGYYQPRASNSRLKSVRLNLYGRMPGVVFPPEERPLPAFYRPSGPLSTRWIDSGEVDWEWSSSSINVETATPLFKLGDAHENFIRQPPYCFSGYNVTIRSWYFAYYVVI